jgi:Protein of unknown function (DUF2958)
MKLLTQAIRSKLPPLGSTDSKPHDQILVQAKFFTPDSSWTWYCLEFDGDDTFFGLVIGFEVEMGYFALSELEAARGPLGLPIERDLWFKPAPLSQVPEYARWVGAG